MKEQVKIINKGGEFERLEIEAGLHNKITVCSVDLSTNLNPDSVDILLSYTQDSSKNVYTRLNVEETKMLIEFLQTQVDFIEMT